MDYSHMITGNDTVNIAHEKPLKNGPVMRRFALFMDGMARAVILPFGPALIYRILYGTPETGNAEWALVGFSMSMLVSVYITGRWLGTSLAMTTFSRRPKSQLPKHVARLGGALLALHIFTYGAGLSSVRVLLFIRFLSATLAGILCGVTRSIQLPEDGRVSFCKTTLGSEEEESAVAATWRRREGYVDIASGTAKIYLTGFAVSILSGGLLFRKAAKDHTFQALTGAYQYSWSPLFLVAVGVVTEIVLRQLFAWTAGRSSSSNPSSHLPEAAFAKFSEQPKLLPIDSIASSSSPPFSRENSFQDAMREVEDDDDNRLGDIASPFRGRVDSYTSMEDFYDCRSVFSDSENTFGRPFSPFQPVIVEHDIGNGSSSDSNNDNTEDELAQYRNGRCLYADGSPAYVPQGDCVSIVPANYMEFFNKDAARAQKAWAATRAWRLEQKVWRIHTMPNHWFSRIKEAYPHFVHGYSKAGYPIIYEQPGRMTLKDLFRSGCDISDMIRHYIFFMEFIANHIATRPDTRARLGPDAPAHCSSTWGTMVVMDVKGAGLSHLSGDIVKYLKQAGDVNSQHYPLTMKRAFLVNSPFWLAGAWSGLKSILPESVQVDILSESKYPEALRQYIDEDQIPPEYGGTSPYKLGEHPYEVELKELVELAAKRSEEEEEPDVADEPPMPLTVDVTPTKALPSSTKSDDSSSLLATPPNVHPVRRRLTSVDRVRRHSINSRGSINGLDMLYSGDKLVGGEADVFLIVSIAHCLWSTVQGAIEAAIPLWILSPTSVGGLGYSPSRSGVSMFCACLSLLWVLRSNASRVVSRIPSKAPLRALRIGAGSEAVLFGLLAYVSSSYDASERKDSVFVMASTIVVFACIALASMIGRTASKILHRIAAEWYARQAKAKQQGPLLTKYYSMARFASDCETGRFTAALNITFEVFGSFLFATLWSWSVTKGRRAPLDGTSIFFASALATFILYVGSFSLHLNAAGEFAPHPKDKCSDSVSVKRWLAFVLEVVAVSAGDMASLFEEANWANSALLVGRARARTFSESSARADYMERGGTSRFGGKEI